MIQSIVAPEIRSFTPQRVNYVKNLSTLPLRV